MTALGVVAAGCGGGRSGTRYSKPTPVACLQQKGVQTQDISHPVTAADKAVAARIRPIDPNFIAAKFPSGEFVGIAFAVDSDGAKKVTDKLQALAKEPGATPSKITQKGSIVVLTSPHVTAGVRNTLDHCESSAAKS